MRNASGRTITYCPKKQHGSGILNSFCSICNICLFIVQFQKIAIPTPRKANSNSKGEGLLKAQFFKGNYDAKLQFLEGVVQAYKPFKGGMDISWNCTFTVSPTRITVPKINTFDT